MNGANQLSPAERLKASLDLFEFGEAMMRQNLRRSFPLASIEEIEGKLTEWLQNGPLLWSGQATAPVNATVRRDS